MQRRLLVGLGNPGAEHRANRHNIGFMVIDEIARRHGVSPWRRQFEGQLCELRLQQDRIVLLKPQTYMNESGRSVQEAVRFFNVTPSDLTVFHDEIELPPTKVRVKVGGSDAGHNGLRSISRHLGIDYKRVRLGIGHPRDWLGPGHPDLKDVVHRYVLSDFPKSDRPWVGSLCEAIAENIGMLVADRDSSFLNKIHLAMQASGFAS
jgi:peptidyl-tRNA hydrolase, PTH1 family